MKTWGMVAALALALAAGCSGKGSSEPKKRLVGVGVAVSPGRVTDMRVAPDGSAAVFLKDGAKPLVEGVPPLMLTGQLRVAKLDGAAERALGDGVTNVPGGFYVSADSRWVVFLAGFSAAAQVGALTVADLKDLKKDPAKVADGVSYSVVSPDGKWLAFVANGVLRAGPVEGGPWVEVAGEVAVAHFSPDSAFLLVKRRGAAGGALLRADVGQWSGLKKLADQVGDFLVSSDAKHVAFGTRSARVQATYELNVASAPGWAVARVGEGVGWFDFSPDSRFLGSVQNQPPGPNQLGDLYVGKADGSAARKIASQASMVTFAPDSNAVAYLGSFKATPPPGIGTLGVAALPEGPSRDLGKMIGLYEWAPDGKTIAYSQRSFAGGFTVDLKLYALGAVDPVTVESGVYGYGFTQDNQFLLYRTSCIRDGRACDLYALALSTPRGTNDAGVMTARGKKIAQGIFQFFKPAAKGPRVLVTYSRMDSQLYDVGVVNAETGGYKTMDESALLPPAFAAPDGARVVYAVAEKSRPGLYVADKVP